MGAGGVALATLVPGSAAVVSCGALLADRGIVDWWDRSRKPSWALRNLRLCSAIDFLTTAPFGCASYLVYKHGGGFDNVETRTALCVYGSGFVVSALGIPMVLKRSFKGLFCTMLLQQAVAGGTAYLFYRVHRRAGLMMLPFALWTFYYVCLTHGMWRLNEFTPPAAADASVPAPST